MDRNKPHVEDQEVGYGGDVVALRQVRDSILLSLHLWETPPELTRGSSETPDAPPPACFGSRRLRWCVTGGEWSSEENKNVGDKPKQAEAHSWARKKYDREQGWRGAESAHPQETCARGAVSGQRRKNGVHVLARLTPGRPEMHHLQMSRQGRVTRVSFLIL